MTGPGSRPRGHTAITTAVAVALCTVGLAASGRALPFPDVTAASDLGRWARSVGPATTAFTGLRALAVGLLGWCVLTTVVGVVARRSHRPGVVALADRLSPRAVRHLAEAVAGVGIVVAGLSPALGAGATGRAAPAVAMVDLGPVMTDLGTVEPPLPTPPAAAPAMAADEATGSPTWTIEPGDTLWHVAEETASVELGRPADTAEVVRRLDELVTLNADRLAVPGDPSLVFPGQVFLLG